VTSETPLPGLDAPSSRSVASSRPSRLRGAESAPWGATRVLAGGVFSLGLILGLALATFIGGWHLVWSVLV
jgi:hypothetical protein